METRTTGFLQPKQHAKKCIGNGHSLTGEEALAKGIPCDCDGYHTFTELYDHRITLYIKLAAALADRISLTKLFGGRLFEFESYAVWRSKRHSDGEICFGTGTQFVLGIGKKPGKQITYHIPIERWSETDFAEDLKKAPEFDGHTSDDVLKRLKTL